MAELKKRKKSRKFPPLMKPAPDNFPNKPKKKPPVNKPRAKKPVKKKKKVPGNKKLKRNPSLKKRPKRKQRPAKRPPKQKDNLVYRGEAIEKRQKQERLQRRHGKRIKEINSIKRKIVDEYGKEPTICFYYYLWNAVEYVGEKRVRDSFKSIQGQGDEVIVADYDSTDDTKKIALEYGFRVLDVEKTEGIMFHETKIGNKVMWSNQCNFLVDLNINTTYPNTMGAFYKNWIKDNDITQKMLVGRGIFHKKNGVLDRNNSASCLFYRPFLIKFRGWDERFYYGYGATHYAYCLLVDVLELNLDNRPLEMHHAYHTQFKKVRWRNIFKIADPMREHMRMIKAVEDCQLGFYNNLDNAIKNVRNSYW